MRISPSSILSRDYHEYNDTNDLYFSYARANRELGTTFESDLTKPEQLNDFELGWRHKKEL
jgi:iron complex outermembrane receptor protein